MVYAHREVVWGSFEGLVWPWLTFLPLLYSNGSSDSAICWTLMLVEEVVGRDQQGTAQMMLTLWSSLPHISLMFDGTSMHDKSIGCQLLADKLTKWEDISSLELLTIITIVHYIVYISG